MPTPALAALEHALGDVDNLIAHHPKAITDGANPSDLPEALRAFLAEQVRKDPWRLAGESWRAVAVAEVTTLTRGDDAGSFGFNTAGPWQINTLHCTILGENLLNKCRWSKRPNRKVKEDLAEFVKIRGAIAHTGQPLGPLHLAGIRDWQNFIQRLARNLDGHIEGWVAQHRPDDAGS